MKQGNTKEARYHPPAKITSISANVIGPLNPWIPLWWSAAFMGFGHFLLGNILTACILVCFEFVVNNMAHVNDAIYLSMIGDIKGAERILDLRWFFGYIGVFVFTMYDSYRRTIEHNKVWVLSYRYPRKLPVSALSTLEINILDKTSPFSGMFWSLITPGLGSVFTHRLPTFMFSLIWWGVVTVQSHWFEGIYYSAIGDFERVKQVVVPQWLLFMPSLLGFSAYFNYKEAVKVTKQFKLSQAQYLSDAYQSEAFIKPV